MSDDTRGPQVDIQRLVTITSSPSPSRPITRVNSLSDINTVLYRDIVSCLISGERSSSNKSTTTHAPAITLQGSSQARQKSLLASPASPSRYNCQRENTTLKPSRMPTVNESQSRKSTLNDSLVKNTGTETFRVADFILDYKKKLDLAEKAARRTAQKRIAAYGL